MNNKEFTSELAERLGYTIKDTAELIGSLLSDMVQELEEGNVIAVQGFGSFEVKRNVFQLIRQVNNVCWFLPNWCYLINLAIH